MMEESAVLAELKDAIGTYVTLTPQTLLADIPEWDSVSAMTVVTMVAMQYHKPVALAEVKNALSVADLLLLIDKV